ncbi:P-type DNA transfer ATPase VirB11 [Kingella kingae]|uniref:P-type DNA transfer ATPase VirB11 n=2 Tax=Kingella kingae TaxID=504 RepID=UPI00030E5967|nr:P-type DNA transfer ATPase VirB11 [Kingella kingae]MDK4555934.1 P-type DNA transfer ATPase VirB11 [Kingella kingae]MDK4585032.1 P-type DNA transfer ATPase VirB11 [Kingella kingae]MDK4589020.1 P-type DNA transfer ATPase VirB11 [Kingella kingae]MDK4597235.1 P-type DNA transfer ATPase VirB11 [Kingella kingae]MDK4601196.1 P-type DNA transfer ATPase VirB11 [Kingella kingae]
MTNHTIRADASARNLLDNLGITELLNQNGVTEVMINRPHELFIERATGTERLEMPDLSLDKLRHLANILTTFNQKHLTEKDPIHSVTLPDGERGQILIPPSCENGTIVFSFRKPSNSRFSLDDYVKTERLNGFVDVAEINGKQFADVSGSLKLTHDVQLADWEYKLLEYKENRDLNAFFQLAVEKHLNICMVGGTGSGKTTFTKAIADLIDPKTRIITIEDTHELDLPKHPNHVHLFYKEHITAKQIIAACMRLKPDRIFLTELRGDEAWDYLSALNTGHAGGLTSVHANNAESVFYRIAQLAKESATGRTMDYDFILNTVRSTIDVVCFFNRTYMTELYYNPVAKLHALQGR